jgi:hypothetical protein
MPRQRSTKATQDVIDGAQAVLSLELVAELAEPLARYMLGSYADEEWRDSPQVEALARAAALLEPGALRSRLRSWRLSGKPLKQADRSDWRKGIKPDGRAAMLNKFRPGAARWLWPTLLLIAVICALGVAMALVMSE